MRHSKSWLEFGDYALHFGGTCGAPSLVVSPAWEATHCIGMAATEPPGSAQNNILRIGIHLHAFYVESCTEILRTLKQTVPQGKLLITTDSAHKKAQLETLLKHDIADTATSAGWSHCIVVTPNKGRNVLPLLREAWPRLRCCDIVIHLHTKRTPHQDFGEEWSRELVDTLVGTPATVNAVATAFATNPLLGMVIPRPCEAIRPFLHWGANFELACWISKSLWSPRQLSIEAPLVFPAGMMFWFRPKALEPLIPAERLLQQPPQEPVLMDGTSLHAIERLTLHACEVAGYDWRYVGQQEHQTTDTPKPIANTCTNLSVWIPQSDAYLAGVAALAQQHKELQQTIAQLQRLLQRSQSLEAEQMAVLETYSQTKKQLEQELLAMRQSLSWRLMGPARRFARSLRCFPG